MSDFRSLESEEDEYLNQPHESITLYEYDPGADMPVPDRLFPKWKSRHLVNRLKLSQKIGILLWLNRTEGPAFPGRDRLLYLQSKAPIGAIEAGLKFCQRLENERKLQSDFRPHARELNRRPQSKRFRRYETSRIGIGYRDKGTLPEESSLARRDAHSEGFISLSSFDPRIEEAVLVLFPDFIVDGEWLDPELLPSFDELGEEQKELVKLLSPL